MLGCYEANAEKINACYLHQLHHACSQTPDCKSVHFRQAMPVAHQKTRFVMC